jgi:hypothetical protein
VSAAPIGAVVNIHIDFPRRDELVHVGDEIITRTGRAYGVLASRQQTRGKNFGRWHLRCVVLDPTAPRAAGIDGSGRTFNMTWYQRGRRA